MFKKLFKKEAIDFEDLERHKKIVIQLRWATIIVTSYLILFNRNFSISNLFPILLIFLYIASNIGAHFIPSTYFTKLPFFYIVLLFDTIIVSLGIYLTSQFDTDFYLVYFLIIIFASTTRSFKLLMIISFIICGIYGWLLLGKGWGLQHLEEGVLLRIPFIFIMNLFYGFLIQSFEERTKKIRKELKEIEESEYRYRQIVESSHDAVVILDEDQKIKFFNNKFIQLTKYTFEEIKGMDFEKLLETGGFEEFRREMVHEQKVIRGIKILPKDGDARDVEISFSKYFLSNIGFNMILYIKDITERKRFEDVMSRTERLRALGEMTAGIAHDFNNVLGAILGRIQLIKMKLKDEENFPLDLCEKELSIVENAAKDGASTVRKLLEFAKSKIDEPNLVPVDVNKIIKESVELMKAKIIDDSEAKGIKIEVKIIENEVPPIMGNPVELKEVLLNLIINSIDAMPKGGKITFYTGKEDGHVFIKISDNGIGIPEYIRDRIFEPFFTTKGIKSSGLGLSVSYGIINRYNGKIEVSSDVGKGTTFLIKFPVFEGFSGGGF